MAVELLPTASFFDLLDISGEDFYLSETMSHERDRAGRVYTSETGPRLWRGSLKISDDVNWDAHRSRAILGKVMRPGVQFLLYSRAAQRPRSDPRGASVQASTVRLHTVHEDLNQIRLIGLPSGYKLSVGDALSWYQPSNGTYRYHEVTEDVQAVGSLTPLFSVNPPVMASPLLNSIVSLIRPVLKATYVPQSFKPHSAQGVFSSGSGFEWVQILE